MKRKRKKRVNWRGLLNQSLFVLLFATAMVLLTPTPERDTGPPKKVEITDDYLAMPSKQERFIAYIKERGFKIVNNQLPLLIEVSKRQVDGNPSDIANQLAKKGYDITGHKVKVILRTWGGKYIAEYSPQE